MNSLHRNQSGFGHLLAFLAVAVVLATGAVSYHVVNSHKKTNPVTKQTSAISVPAKITSKADVGQALTALNATSIDSGVNSDQLDSDISALL